MPLEWLLNWQGPSWSQLPWPQKPGSGPVPAQPPTTQPKAVLDFKVRQQKGSGCLWIIGGVAGSSSNVCNQSLTAMLRRYACSAAQGGETAALARLKYYLWDSDLLSTYFDTVSGSQLLVASPKGVWVAAMLTPACSVWLLLGMRHFLRSCLCPSIRSATACWAVTTPQSLRPGWLRAACRPAPSTTR